MNHIDRRGRVPVLDPADLGFVPPNLVATFGFEEFRRDDRTILRRASEAHPGGGVGLGANPSR